jgi:uncharacterized protein YyaL (SSP411 family)
LHNFRSVRTRGGGGALRSKVVKASLAPAPDILTTETAAKPRPDATAKIVSSDQSDIPGTARHHDITYARPNTPLPKKNEMTMLPGMAKKDENMLGDETSPYLLQHADNPVHWRAWNDATLAEARDSGKPILLSIGYSACHWCHVMAHQCFENSDIAQLMNKYYVNIKVDREERPDIDSIYQHALSLMGVQGGWPLTMFCLPDTRPFWGGTYFPPSAGHGQPGFADILVRLNAVHSDRSDEVNRNAEALMEGLVKISSPAGGPRLDANDMRALTTQLIEQFDPENGGLHGPPKFPMVTTLKLGWRLSGDGAETADEGQMRLGQLVLHTADRMAKGGIYDHLGGGFARYTVDNRWLAPHFEKMLYDNGQLLGLYAMLHRRRPNLGFADKMTATVAWADREMRHEGGAFYSALDADSEGEEGKFYVWSKSEIDTLLGNDSEAFCDTYDVTVPGNWEGKTILNQLSPPQDTPRNASDPALARCRATLLAHRETRIRPQRDDKILVDWNGLMICGLIEAATSLGRDDWLDMARAAFSFVANDCARGKRLFHTWQAGGPKFDGLLEDYANMILAALLLHEATEEPNFLHQATDWATYVEEHFHAGGNSAGGGYYQSDDTANDVISRTRNCYDQPNPSGNSRMAEIYARLYFLTGDENHRNRSEAIILTFAHDARSHPVGLANLIWAANFLADAAQLVIVPGPAGAGDDAYLSLRKAAFETAGSAQIILPWSGTDGANASLGADHPAFGKGQVGGAATAYVCNGRTCSLPVTDPSHLRTMLAGAGV